MAAQLRDTQVRTLIRLVGGRRRLRYPDEVDPSLWKAILRKGGLETISKKDFSTFEDLQPPLNADVVYEKDKDVLLVDWYGPDDPENPRNWSPKWKLLTVAQICLMNFTFYISSSIYVPGEESIMEDFGTGLTVATLGLSLFSLGYGVGPMLWSPLSEVPRIGRNNIYFFTVLAFVLLQLPAGYAVNMPMFLAFRFLSGFVGSPALTTGGATISDVYPPAQVAYGITIYGWFGICGPVFGPIVGAFAAQAKGWRITMWIITWLGTVTLFVLFFLMPETSTATILYRRAKRLRAATGNEHLRSQSMIDAASWKTKDQLLILARAFVLTFSEPVVFILDLYTALLYGILFTWFESFPVVFGNIYHFNIGQQGLVFLGIFVSSIITLPLYLLWVRYKIVPAISNPSFTPEKFLPPTIIGAVSLPICLFWYGWTARGDIHWIVPIIGSSFFTVGIITLFSPVLTYLGSTYQREAVSVFTGNGLFLLKL